MGEGRKAPRLRVLKAGTITFGGGGISCTVRNFSNTGAAIEHAFGVVIFKRSSGGVLATPAGRHVLRITRSILEQVETLAVASKISTRGETGRLVVGFCTSLTVGNLRATLMDYRTRLTTALRNGVVDICIVTGQSNSFESESLPLWSERILVVLPSDHPLAERDVVKKAPERRAVIATPE